MYDNKKIFVLGMARSGYEVAKVLAKRNNYIVVNDISKDQDNEKVKELESLGVKVFLGDHPDDLLDDSFDYIIKNPGIHFDHKYLDFAGKHSIPVLDEIEIAYHFLPSNVKIVGITGTNGKTTTTTLTYEVLKKYFGSRVHLAGNIGFAFSGVLKDIKENDIVVMEISAQQLHDMYNFKCDVAVLTNIYGAHLDMFGTKEYYNASKKKIFNNQTKDDIAIVNGGNTEAKNLASDIKSNVKYFSSIDKEAICYLDNDWIYYNDEKLIDTKKMNVKGVHNYENAMCAIIVAKEFKVPDDVICDVVENFKGVEHRIEFVRKYNDREFYNDSKATNIKATQIALSAFNNPVILLLGGLERNQDFGDLKEYLKYTKLVVAYGECKDRIVNIMNNIGIKAIKCNVLEEAVNIAYQNSEANDTILLSPASASWDQYKCFELRGEEFKKIVNKLGE